jgi:hypothetical protein
MRYFIDRYHSILISVQHILDTIMYKIDVNVNASTHYVYEGMNK